MKVLSAASNLPHAQAENLRLHAQALWSDIALDWDFHWITSARQPETCPLARRCSTPLEENRPQITQIIPLEPSASVSSRSERFRTSSFGL